MLFIQELNNLYEQTVDRMKSIEALNMERDMLLRVTTEHARSSVCKHEAKICSVNADVIRPTSPTGEPVLSFDYI